MMEEKAPGVLCKVGTSDLAAGVSRLAAIGTSIAGAIVTGVAVFGFWVLQSYVAEVHDTTAKIWGELTAQTQAIAEIKETLAGMAANQRAADQHSGQQDARLDRDDQQLGDLNSRVSRLEGRSSAPP